MDTISTKDGTKIKVMTASLSPSVHNYFSGKNAKEFAVSVSGFALDAVVKDEGLDHKGRAAIRAWIEESAAKYDDKAEMRSVASEGDVVEVMAKVHGKFPGSPVVLRFSFALDGDQISRLEIAP